MTNWQLILIIFAICFCSYLNQIHLHEIGCEVGVERLCHQHLW